MSGTDKADPAAVALKEESKKKKREKTEQKALEKIQL